VTPIGGRRNAMVQLKSHSLSLWIQECWPISEPPIRALFALLECSGESFLLVSIWKKPVAGVPREPPHAALEAR
jgi:hypothetical protein